MIDYCNLGGPGLEVGGTFAQTDQLEILSEAVDSLERLEEFKGHTASIGEWGVQIELIRSARKRAMDVHKQGRQSEVRSR